MRSSDATQSITANKQFGAFPFSDYFILVLCSVDRNLLIFGARIANKVSKVLSTFISTKLKFDIPDPNIVDDEYHPEGK